MAMHKQNLIVSLHVPKTAGTSFLTALEGVFSKDEMLIDYGQADEFEYLSSMGVEPERLHEYF